MANFTSYNLDVYIGESEGPSFSDATYLGPFRWVIPDCVDGAFISEYSGQTQEFEIADIATLGAPAIYTNFGEDLNNAIPFGFSTFMMVGRPASMAPLYCRYYDAMYPGRKYDYLDTINSHGPSYGSRFYDLYFTSPDNGWYLFVRLDNENTGYPCVLNQAGIYNKSTDDLIGNIADSLPICLTPKTDQIVWNDTYYAMTKVVYNYNGVLYWYPSHLPSHIMPPMYYIGKPHTDGYTINNQVDPLISVFLEGVPSVADDPFTPGGSTDPGGGTGTFDDETEPIDFPSLPTLSAVDTGFITLYNPSDVELKALANYMWGSLFDISTWKKIFADPMDAILGLSIVPVAVDDAGPATVTVGNISTGITMNKAAKQYKEVDCGSLNIEEYWGAYLDYDPYTKAELYLPYCGTHPIAVDDIMGKTVHIKYHVDILSGSCCCYVKCGDSVLYTFAGQCSCSIPITGNDWTNVVNGALSIAASIGTMVATGGATAPMAAGAIASTAVNSMKPTVEKSGSLGGMAGMLAIQTPYLILTRPRQALPKDQNRFSGYPSFITKTLGSVEGYTEVESIHLEGIQATDSELAEIENLLKSGVIF